MRKFLTTSPMTVAAFLFAPKFAPHTPGNFLFCNMYLKIRLENFIELLILDYMVFYELYDLGGILEKPAKKNRNQFLEEISFKPGFGMHGKTRLLYTL
jgi:hypothetical protein